MNLKKLLAHITACALPLGTFSPMALASSPNQPPIIPHTRQEAPAEHHLRTPQDMQNFWTIFHNGMVIDFMSAHTQWQHLDSQEMASPNDINLDNIRAFINAFRETLRNDIEFFSTINAIVSRGHLAAASLDHNIISQEEMLDFSRTAHEIVSNIPENQRAAIPDLMIFNSNRTLENRRMSDFYFGLSILFIFLDDFSEYYVANYGA